MYRLQDPLLRFVSNPLLQHLLLDNHHVKHLEPGVEALPGLGAGEDDAPLLLPAELLQGERGHHLPLIERHREVLLVGHDEQRGGVLLVLGPESAMEL